MLLNFFIEDVKEDYCKVDATGRTTFIPHEDEDLWCYVKFLPACMLSGNFVPRIGKFAQGRRPSTFAQG